MITKYLTVCHSEPYMLDEEVVIHLENGWELYGNPYPVYDGVDSYFTQAMIKREEASL